jgi:predicted Zn-dependent protease
MAADVAFRVAERLKAPGPWEVIGEHSRKFEIHLQGSRVELERGPIAIEGYGIRLFRPRSSNLGTGFQASSDLSPAGIATAAADAETIARHAEFPATSLELPSGHGPGPDVTVVDPALWSDPARAVREYVAALLAAFGGRPGAVPSFGSVKATLSEYSMANSAGLRVSYPATHVELEVAVKAFGGPEGRPPGEFWVTESSRRLETQGLPGEVDTWCRYAADVRRAVAPPTGDQAVVLPADVLAGILPSVLGGRFTGAARLRKIAPEVGTTVGGELATVRDDGAYAWGPGSAPFDDEGSPRSRHTLIDHGTVTGLLYDSLYASAFSERSTASADRTTSGPGGEYRFAHAPGPGVTTLVLPPGSGGTDRELYETVGDGILVTQLGWAYPDPIGGTFGGEIRIGYRIKGGKLAEPVRGGTVGGSVLAPKGTPSLLANLEAVGSTPTLAGQVASPAVVVRPLSVAGASG